jgi:hypothetical protein
MTFCWDVAPCRLVEVYWRLRGVCCLHHQGDECTTSLKTSHLCICRSENLKCQLSYHLFDVKRKTCCSSHTDWLWFQFCADRSDVAPFTRPFVAFRRDIYLCVVTSRLLDKQTSSNATTVSRTTCTSPKHRKSVLTSFAVIAVHPGWRNNYDLRDGEMTSRTT